MNINFQNHENENPAQSYYPKSITLGQSNFDQKVEEPQQQSNPSNQSPFSNMFSLDNPLFSQLLGNNPLVSSLFSKGFNQQDMLSKLMSSFLQKPQSKDEKEKIIDISDAIEEL